MNNSEECNPTGFVAAMIQRVSKNDDTACRAALRRADTPATASYAWEYLVPFCDISKKRERLAFALVGAAIAREKTDCDGSQNIGKLLCNCCKNDDDRKREQHRLRRVLACESTEELCDVLRPVLRYLQAHEQRIGYQRLLTDILYWNEQKKLQWAKSFFGKFNPETPSEEENANVPD